MSHVPHRKEKDCLNCGTIVQGQYCHVCGQENIVPKETFWHMVFHFFYDITHFDSSFFHTVHHLVFKPGFLSMEYMRGRRVSYLHPIRMYVFSSAVFFLLFFSVFKPVTSSNTLQNPATQEERKEYVQRLQEQLRKDTGNSALKARLLIARDSTQPLTKKDVVDPEGDGVIISFTDTDYRTKEAYDSAQKALDPEDRDGWFQRRLVMKQIEINTRYKDNPEQVADKFLDSVLHRLPYMLFLSLPLFALILKLVYIRRKQFYYADHGVFTIHLYVFTFLLLMVVFGLDKLQQRFSIPFIGTVIAFLFIGLFLYLLFAMKRFYGQRWGKTILKFLIVSIFSLVMMLALFIGFMFFSAVTF